MEVGKSKSKALRPRNLKWHADICGRNVFLFLPLSTDAACFWCLHVVVFDPVLLDGLNFDLGGTETKVKVDLELGLSYPKSFAAKCFERRKLALLAKPILFKKFRTCFPIAHVFSHAKGRRMRHGRDWVEMEATTHARQPECRTVDGKNVKVSVDLTDHEKKTAARNLVTETRNNVFRLDLVKLETLSFDSADAKKIKSCFRKLL